ncbi:MAG: glutaredoxin family protein [Nevskiaceae bacterium]
MTRLTKPVLLLLGRPGCHLCEEFRDELEQAFPGRFELREACVDDLAEWRERYGLKIPVLLDEQGTFLCATRFDAESLR